MISTRLFIRLSCVLLSLLAGFSVRAQAPSVDMQWTNDFANEVRAEAKKRNIPGFVFVVVERGKPAKFYTFGKTEKRGEAISTNTKFRLASVSKTFTATLIATESPIATTMGWQTPVSEITPEYNFDKYPQKPLLLRHIVGQSTGFMPNAYDNLIEANYQRKRVLKEFQALEPLCEPGYCYTYQNALFGVIEEHYAQRNTSYAKQLQARLFEPLGLEASVGRNALESASSWAKPHAAIARNRWAKVKVKDDYYRFSPAAGINASAKDMEIWIRAMLLEYPDVVSEDMVTEMTLPRVQTKNELRRRGWRQHLNSAHYGLGWRVYNFKDIQLNYHGGWVQGYRADVSFAPELGIGYAFLMNAESNLINQVTADFWANVVNAYEARLAAQSTRN
ncbi:serine hydrolase domain-containing protein [Glaciecola siphonariae]|uniref:Serine hydrolase domain-containing protein n=1 Tax=Glaciecola siphonariae TaxID=521012 RepID=A0ABV9LPZ5_9ALTE